MRNSPNLDITNTYTSNHPRGCGRKKIITNNKYSLRCYVEKLIYFSFTAKV